MYEQVCLIYNDRSFLTKFFDTFRFFYLYARDGAYIYDGLEHTIPKEWLDVINQGEYMEALFGEANFF